MELHLLTHTWTWLQEHLGYYETAEEAALCYARASRATNARPMPGPVARSAAPPHGPGSVAASAISSAAGVLLPAWGHCLPATAVELAASVIAGAGARSANANEAGELLLPWASRLQHMIEDSFEQELWDRGAVTRPAAAAPPPPKPPPLRPAPPKSQPRTNGPHVLASVCDSTPVTTSWAGLLEWQEALLPRFTAGVSGAFYAAPSVHEGGLKPAFSCTSPVTVTGPMPPSEWLVKMGRERLSTHPSPLPPPPPSEVEEALLSAAAELMFAASEVEEALMSHALSQALGTEGQHTAAPPKRAAAGGAADDLPPMQSMASKRPRHT